MMIFLLFYLEKKKGFDISCKLSTLETNGWKCQILFSMKNTEHISKCRYAETFTRSAEH